MGHGVTEYTCRMIFRRVSGLGFVISTLNNAGDRPYPENSGGREIDPFGRWYPSDESPGLSQLPKPSWHLTCQTALSAHPLRAPACARLYTNAMPNRRARRREHRRGQSCAQARPLTARPWAAPADRSHIASTGVVQQT